VRPFSGFLSCSAAVRTFSTESAHLGHRAIATPGLEAAIRVLRPNRRKTFAGRFPKAPFGPLDEMADLR
jgi:hypothetical protein